MAIIEYADCLAVTYGGPEDAERSDYRFVVPVWLPNGRLTEVTVCALRVRGGFRVTGLLLDKDLSREDVQDLAELEWHVFPKDKPGTRVPPVVRFWNEPQQENVVAACVPDYPRSGWRAWEPGGAGNMWDQIELCPWPKFQAVVRFKELFDAAREKKAGFMAAVFYSFGEYCRKSAVQGTPISDLGTEYAQYLAYFRTFLMVGEILRFPVLIKIGDVDRALEAIKEHGLKAEDPSAWEKIGGELEDMPEILVEEEWMANGPFPELTGIAAPMGHLGKGGYIDCLVAELFSGGNLVGRLVYWPNPVLPREEALKRAKRMVLDRLAQLGAKVKLVSEVQPFPNNPTGARAG